MNDFRELLSFEYKKVFCKKSICILLVLGLILTALRSIIGIEGLNGLASFFELADTTVLILFFITSICIAPLFAEEYTTRVDQLILTSANGKRKLIWAKLIVGVSVGIGLFVIFFGVAYLGILLMHGFEMRSQEEWRALWIYCGSVMIANTFSAVIYMLFSAKLKSAYSAIVVSFLFIIGCRVLCFPESSHLIRGITQLLPIQMASLATVFSSFTYSVAGIEVPTYQLIPFIAVGLSATMIPWVYQTFKNHQSY